MGNKKLYKSRTDKMIAGVCGGIGKFLGIDSNIVRLVIVASSFAGGSGIIIYLLAAILLPTR